MSRPRLCWIVISFLQYHAARMRAVAARGACDPHVIKITDTNEFCSLSHSSSETAFGRQTLFPGTPLSAVNRIAMAAVLHRRLSALEPDVVCINGWSIGGCIAALAWCRGHSVPAVVMSDSTAHDEPRRWWKERIKRRIVNLASAALVAGQPHVEYLVQLGFPADRIATGYDTVDNDHFEIGADRARCGGQPLRQRLDLPDRYFLASGRFVEKKNLPRLLQAYAIYRRSAGASPWSLVLVGDGPLRRRLPAYIDQLGLGDGVRMPGFQSYEALPSYYGLADAFIHASTTEQWGLVVNEAMAAGLPVLVSERCGCARDLVRPGVNGFLFDPFDVDDMARAMGRVAGEYSDRRAMGKASRRIVRGWSPDRFAEGLMRAAAAALAAPRSPVSVSDRVLLAMLRYR